MGIVEEIMWVRMTGLQKNGKSGPRFWGREVLTHFAQQFVTAVTAPPPVGGVVWKRCDVVYINVLLAGRCT